MATIVLADDHDELRRLYATTLRVAGHQVREACDGQEAVEAVRECVPQLLILDLWMPRCNGFEALEQLRDEPAAAHMPVAMLSAMGESDAQLECFSLGAIEYWVKGMSLSDLRDKVEHLLAATLC